MQKISGTEIAQDILANLKTKKPPEKILAAILVGEDPSSVSFIAQKGKEAKELGIDFRVYRFDKDIANDELRRKAGEIAQKKPVGGVIVQLPLPPHINRHYILNSVPREKDVDVLGERALGAFYTGRNLALPGAASVVKEILHRQGYEEFSAAVVGLGLLVGKPVAHYLMAHANALTLIDEGGDVARVKEADVVVLGAGKAGIVDSPMLKYGALVIDFGYSLSGGKLRGDFNPEGSESLKGLYTPTPGGTGPILVAKLLENFYALNV